MVSWLDAVVKHPDQVGGHNRLAAAVHQNRPAAAYSAFSSLFLKHHNEVYRQWTPRDYWYNHPWRSKLRESPETPRAKPEGSRGLPKFAPEGWLFTRSSRWAWCYNILSLNQILIGVCHINYLKAFNFFMCSIFISNMFCYTFVIVKVGMAQLVECSSANFWARVRISVESNTILGTIICRDD